MELAQKGQEANIAALEQAIIKMKWSTAADFDIAAIWKKKDGTTGMVYFGDKGKLNEFPFVQAGEDAGVGDTGGDHEETLKVVKLDDELAKLYILAWDYGALQKGEKARFSDSDMVVSMVDQAGENHAVTVEVGDMGNTALVATIDNTSPIGAKLVNNSEGHLFKEFKSLEQFTTWIDGVEAAA